MTFFVYGLFDSGDWNKTKYIGAASWLGRPLQHAKQAQDLNNRTRKHHGIRKIQRDNRHIGWKILEVCDSWKETLATENRLILEYKAKHNGNRPDWNMTDGGEGLVGFVYTPEIRAKFSAVQMGKVLSIETRRKIGESSKGRKMSVDARKKIGTARKGKFHSVASREKMSLSRKGKSYPKISVAAKGRVFSLEIRNKLSISHLGNTAMLGKLHTLESRKKMCVSQIFRRNREKISHGSI